MARRRHSLVLAHWMTETVLALLKRASTALASSVY